MMKKIWVLLVVHLCYLQLVFADNSIQPALSTIASGEGTKASRKFTLIAQLSLFMPFRFTLDNGNLSVAYAESFKGFPFFQLIAGEQVALLGNVELQAQLSLGYAHKSGPVILTDSQGAQQEAFVNLHWIPASLSARFAYRISSMHFLKPSITTGLGLQWLYQSAHSQAVNHHFWVPFAFVRPAITFFDPLEEVTGDWFGGLILGVSYLTDLGASQVIRGFSYEVGLAIIL
ncbi:MAG: hypothetical protein HY537_11970 [Deltaproteobacteria bacterium]|nr:hypothetical protein [Deltaproteobacteria bacterium]